MGEIENLGDTLEGQMLSEVNRMTLALARNLQERAIAAKSNDEAAGLARAYALVTRGLRQTIALAFRINRELRADSREAGRTAEQRAEALEKARLARIDQKARRINGVMQTLIWREYDPADPPEDDEPYQDPDGEALNDAFVAWARAARQRPDFETADEDELLEECMTHLGLTWAGRKAWDADKAARDAAEADTQADVPAPADSS